MNVVFGKKIRAARKAAGLTQRQLADRIGVSNTAVSNWEQDLSRPDADTLQQLCQILQLQPNDFYGAAPASRAAVSDEDIKFALFGGDGEITDAMFDEVKRFAAFIREREKQKE